LPDCNWFSFDFELSECTFKKQADNKQKPIQRKKQGKYHTIMNDFKHSIIQSLINSYFKHKLYQVQL
jgi:hypothetical protein